MRTDEKAGPLQVRLLPEASIWLRAYNNAARVGQQASTQKRSVPATETVQSRQWEMWVRKKLDYDRWLAQKIADTSNTQLSGISVPTTAKVGAAPVRPGVIPPDLLGAAGNPPSMYAAVLPRSYRVTFDDGQVLQYVDNIASGSSRNPSYRFAQGVISFGTRLRDWPQQDLEKLFSQLGLSPFEQRVVRAVSVLEGGFDSVNTYDTGYVSVGFIQFASLGAGAGSLGAVLKRQKQLLTADFVRDFRRFGVDVDPSGTIVVIDPKLEQNCLVLRPS